jgi:hypothetical protein
MSAIADPLQPTIIYEPRAEQSKANSFEVSQAPVGLVSGIAPRFSDETAALLRRRLKAASLFLAILLSGALIRNMVVFGPIAPVDLQAMGLLSFFC